MKTKQAKEFILLMYRKPTLEEISSYGVVEYAFIKHDLDVNEDGTIKKEHYHLYIKCGARRTLNSVSMHFGVAENLVEYCSSQFASIRYMTHIDYDDKWQYSQTSITTNIDLTPIFQMKINDTQFISDLINKIYTQEIKTFHDLVNYALLIGKVDLVSKRTYFFITLLKERG